MPQFNARTEGLKCVCVGGSHGSWGCSRPGADRQDSPLWWCLAMRPHHQMPSGRYTTQQPSELRQPIFAKGHGTICLSSFQGDLFFSLAVGTSNLVNPTCLFCKHVFQEFSRVRRRGASPSRRITTEDGCSSVYIRESRSVGAMRICSRQPHPYLDDCFPPTIGRTSRETTTLCSASPRSSIL